MTRRQAGAVIQLLVVLVAGVTGACAVVATDVVPERFLRDADHIEWVMNSPVGSSDASVSYRNIATFYTLLGLNHQPELAAFLTVSVFTVAVFTAARWAELARFGIVGLAVVVICFLCAGVYLAQYSKECIPLALVLVLLVLPRRGLSEVFFLGLVVLYAVWFRPYWAIVAALYVVWRVLLSKRRHPLTIMVTVLLLYLVLEVLFLNVLGTSLTGQRDLVNDDRVGQDVGSLITDPLPSTPLLMVPNAVLLLLSLLVPVPLMLDGSLFHLLSGLMIAFLWIVALTQVSRAWVKRPGAGLASEPPSRRLRAERSAALLIAVVSVQAIFEPDFGSYLKHLTPLMPLFLTLVPLQRYGRSAWDLPRSAPRSTSDLVSVLPSRPHGNVPDGPSAPDDVYRINLSQKEDLS